MRIRWAEAADRPQWQGLWDQYLAFYKVDLAAAVTNATWARLLDPACPMGCRLAEDGAGRILGFALHLSHPSSWVPGEDCYLEDLFVAPDTRGAGVGRALIDDLVDLARAKGWHRLYWHTDQDNARARALYDSYTPSDGHLRYRMKL